jgi:hypothetical protein
MTHLPARLAESDPLVEERFLDRGEVLHRVQAEKLIVSTCLEEMQAEQDDSIMEPDHGATSLGSAVLKLLAYRYRDHPDFDPAWSVEVSLGPEWQEHFLPRSGDSQ